MAIKDLLELQVGPESTWGTPVAPTALLMAIDPDSVVITPTVEAELIPELRGSLAPGWNVPVRKVGGAASIGGVVTYEDITYFLDGLDLATPQGAGPYTRAYIAPLGTAPSPLEQTIVFGDGTTAHSLEGAVLQTLTIAAESGSPATFEAEYIGEEVNDDAIAALSDRTVIPVMADHAALTIDAVGGTMGATAITTPFFSYELVINTNRELVYGLGSLKPSRIRETKWTMELKLVLEVDATIAAYLTSILAASTTLVHQVEIAHTSGTNIFQIQFAGFFPNAPEVFGDEDGVTTYELNYEGIYNTALGNSLKLDSTNGVSSNP